MREKSKSGGVEKYLKNYARNNKLTLTQEKMKFFIETWEKFLESIPTELQIFLQVIQDQNQ